MGCGQSSFLSENWTEHTQQFNRDMIHELNSGNTQLFVYRMPTSPANEDAINIYIDGSYLTSLHENRFKEITLCAGKHTVNAQFSKQDPAYDKKHNMMQNLEFLEDEHVFLRVTTIQNKPAFSIEPIEQAMENLGQTYRQTHALPRTHKSTVNCIK